MAAMTRAFDLRSVAGWLRLVGLLEAVSWVGLLVGMYFKYVGSPSTEIGVKIFGPIHGGVFIGFVVAAVAAGVAFRWGVTTWLLALLASVVPLATVIFLIWADRTGRMGPAAASVPASATISQPGRTAPETT
ncbi:DUF3817 domain-containing protein [Mycobacterium sp. CPCC 205372]|uniref:DUF3817 domain-containing protein n=1 Tax=Mycobacterium hippophais TaxID=3016340 RepID=A0ABT4PQP1_9MYCO|nr:DUF3817 domain-containing protein [Mycobacterium hippophais]MCZ8378885.1 DUF3817 domain-containing protein [Mycobacterium hippophais]